MTCEISYRPPSRADIAWVADNMRQSDVDEIRALGVQDVHEALNHGVKTSKWAAAAVWGEEPLCIIGVTEYSDLLGKMGSPWMLGTPVLHKTGRTFWTESKKIVYAMSQDYPFLVNYVWEGSEKSVKWLQKLGFKMEEPLPRGPEGQGFHRFSMEA